MMPPEPYSWAHVIDLSSVVMVLIDVNDDGDDDDSGIKRDALHIIPLRSSSMGVSSRLE